MPLRKKKLPTAAQMKNFAARYTTEQWKLITESRTFMEVFTENLPTATLIATKIINGTWKEIA